MLHERSDTRAGGSRAGGSRAGGRRTDKAGEEGNLENCVLGYTATAVAPSLASDPVAEI